MPLVLVQAGATRCDGAGSGGRGTVNAGPGERVRGRRGTHEGSAEAAEGGIGAAPADGRASTVPLRGREVTGEPRGEDPL